MDEATDNISNNEDETLTWRIDQANKFLNQAISGKPAGRSNEKNRVKEDLNAINDLIKNQIWIKKNNDSNH